MRKFFLTLAVLVLGLVAYTQVQANPHCWGMVTGNWVSNNLGPAHAFPGWLKQGRHYVTFMHRGNGVFHVSMNRPDGTHEDFTWRATGPYSNDAKYTYFYLNGEPARVGRPRNRGKILEINYNNRRRFIELLEARR